MKRFRFNLEKLLELRVYDEKGWEIKLGQIVSKCNTMERRIRGYESDKKITFFKFNLKNSGIDMLHLSENYLQKLNYEINQSELKLDSYKSEKQKIQAEYIKASNKRKILDKLKSKEELAYYKKQAVEEMKEIDDISIGIALRKRINKVQSA
ncbi:MAG: flagellar export protein FliJ [Spirochaetes bacterium]|nr:MAG: flagellar export protein FliJ [Spirochaetota bacterium]